MKQLETVQSEWLKKTWDEYPPEWFITLHWRTNPQKIETVESYIKEFHRIFRRKFHWNVVKLITPELDNISNHFILILTYLIQKDISKILRTSVIL